MSTKIVNEYNPETVSPPGDTLAEMLEERKMTQAELCERTGRPRKTINEILKGKAAITPETALQLERVLGVPASFWNNRQRTYDEYQARTKEEDALQQYLPWLDSFPCLHDMVKESWIPSRTSNVLQLDALLAFFGVNTPDEWNRVWGKPSLQAALRDSATYHTDAYALAAYLRKAEMEAAARECAVYNRRKFSETLRDIREFIREPPDGVTGKLADICAAAGVSVAYVPLIKGVHIAGAARWLSADRALLVFSGRGGKEDIFWFSFFHEAAHILFHGKSAIFIESEKVQSEQEDEADAFARDFLIPAKEWQHFARSGQEYNEAEIRGFSEDIGVSPAIVVGRLQHEGLLSHGSALNRLKRSITF